MEDPMPAAKPTDPSPPEKKVPRPRRVAVRNALSGEFVTVGPRGGTSDKFVVKKTSFKTLTERRGDVSKLLERFADAASRAKRSGEAVDFTIKVTPDEEGVSIDAAPGDADALDAALAAAKARGAVHVADILKAPDMLSARDFAPVAGMSHETVNQKRKTGELLGLQGATRGVRFPRWQVTDDGRPLPGLKVIFELLGGDPWTVYRFLTQRHNELAGKTALEALKKGRVEAVQGVARNISVGAFA
jgi:hypothetical protein